MASRVCWHCGTTAHHTRIGPDVESTVADWRQGSVWFATYRCDECSVLSIGYAYERERYGSARRGETVLDEEHLLWLPKAGAVVEFEHVPEHIASPASEAHSCHSIGAYRGASILARAVVEATAKNKGAGGDNLFRRIQALGDQGVIRKVMTTMAHDIRQLGNTMAHGDFEDSPTEEDSAEILSFMDALLAEVYQHDGMVTARRARRQRPSEG